jgi:DeoR/GlpR family transcriptional regulator of sugar metabolism
VDHQVDLFAEERQELLLELLRTDGKVRVQDASALFGVSPDTIRRDLYRLVRAGIAIRTHGGALIRTKPAKTVAEDKTGSEPKSTIGQMAAVHADLCFLGACSIGLEFGVGAIEADELPIKQQMIESSAKVIALAAKEKFSAAAAFSVCPLNAVDTIITDQSPPQSLLDRYQAIQVATVAP